MLGPRSLVIAAVLVAAVHGVRAQDTSSPIATDRPGFAFNTGVVGKGVVQLELGVPQVTEYDSGDATSRVYSAVGLLRLGVAEHWEVRIGAPMYNFLRINQPGPDTDDEGFGDAEIGAKVHVLDAKGGTPAICLIPSIILPTGATGFSGEDPGATFNATFEWTTRNGWSLKDLTGLASYAVPPDDRTTQWTEAFAFGRTIGSSKWSAYGELGALDNDLPGTGVAAYLGGGIAVLAGNDVQLDLYFDRGLTDDAADWLHGFGVSARFGRVR
jgi:hypothetical protein